MASKYKVSIDGAEPKKGTGISRQVILTGRPANFRFNHSNWARRLPRQLDDTEMDCLTILQSLYAIDRVCKRSPNPEGWSREIACAIPLRRPVYWRKLTPRIHELFGAMTSDALRLEFVKASAPLQPTRLTQKELPPANQIALLSGGVDSFVGGVRAAGLQETLFLSHSTGGATTNAQSAVRECLMALPGSEFTSFTAKVRRKELVHPFPPEGETEESERSRTLLFVGVAAVIARARGCREILVNENGIMAIHTPIAEARIGSYSTKTAAPSVLLQMREVINECLQTDLTIRNLLLHETKADVVQQGVDSGVGSVLPRTVSCWSMNRHAGIHCGYCVPCLVRRISFLSAKAGDTVYEFDVISSAQPPNDRAVDNIVHFFRFAHDLVNLDDGNLEAKYGEIIEDTEEISPAQSLALHRRWGQQIKDVVDANSQLKRFWGGP